MKLMRYVDPNSLALEIVWSEIGMDSCSFMFLHAYPTLHARIVGFCALSQYEQLPISFIPVHWMTNTLELCSLNQSPLGSLDFWITTYLYEPIPIMELTKFFIHVN